MHDEPPGAMPAAGAGSPPPPPPPPRDVGATRYDPGFVGPLLPPPPPGPMGKALAGAGGPGAGIQAPSAAAPAVTDAVLSIPLGTRELVAQALDLLTRPDAGLRSASFYIGFILLVTVTPLVALLALAFTSGSVDPFDAVAAESWAGWMSLAAVPAVLGYLAAGVEARALATAVIGGRVEGRPLRLRESIALARRRFWRILVAQLLLGLAATLAGSAVSAGVAAVVGAADAIDFGVSLLVSVLVSAPFVYVPAGIVLGEVRVMEAIRRSVRLVRFRKGLAVVVALFSVLSQFIVLLGLGAGLDAVARAVSGAGLGESVPAALVVPMAAAVVFALGTLVFLVEAIAAAPAVHAFAALTHYTRGLETGRLEPVRGTGLWHPWMTPGLAAVALVALVALLGGVTALGL